MAGEQCENLEDLSRFLGFAPQRIFYLVRYSDNLYREIQIPKRRPSTEARLLTIPSSELKGVQREILRKVLADIPVSERARAYQSGRSPLLAARELAGAPALLSIDLRNFFPSITAQMVFSALRRHGFSQKVAGLLSRLTTVGGVLSQGAPTSPCLSNIVFRRADNELKNICTSRGIEYIRYSDDIFMYSSDEFNWNSILGVVRVVLERHGFTINDDKTRYVRRGVIRKTLGLMTHTGSPTISKSDRRVMRALFHRASQDAQFTLSRLSQLHGLLEWYRCVYGRDQTFRYYSSVLRTAARLRVHVAYASL